MYVDDDVSSLLQHTTDFLPKIPAERDAGLRTVAVNWLAATDANDVRLRLSSRNVRRDDVDMVTAATSLASEEMNVLADPSQVGIVVFRHQRYPQRLFVVG